MATSNLEISINHVLKGKITSLLFFFWHLAAHLDGMVVSFLEEQTLGKSHSSGVLRLVCHSALVPWMVRGGFPMGARLPTYKMASINHSFKNTRIWVFIKSVLHPCVSLTLKWGVSLFFEDSRECSVHKTINIERSGSAPSIMWAKHLTPNKHIFWNLPFGRSLFTIHPLKHLLNLSTVITVLVHFQNKLSP